MPINPILKKLGFAATDRVAIIHTDDIGVSAGSVAAARDLWQAGIISASATMAPCAWFMPTAALCRENPKIDMGVHITLTSEWDTLRWGPISTVDPASGLRDAQGYFHRTNAPVQQGADPQAAGREMRAQIKRALAQGIDVTHIDSHMGTVFCPSLLPVYLEVAREYRVPAMVTRMGEEQFRMFGFDEDRIVFFARTLAALEDEGLPIMDHIDAMDLDNGDRRAERVCARLDTLPAGLSYFIIHPQHDTPECRMISEDWSARAGDYSALMDERVRAHIKHSGLQVIGYRAVRDAMRG